MIKTWERCRRGSFRCEGITAGTLFEGTVLRTENLTKVFGKTRVVKALSIEVKKGEVFGLLGPNGAGKTTAIEMILGLVRPTCGRIEIMGRAAPYGEADGRRHIGAMIDGVAFYRHLSGIDNLMALGGVSARSKGGRIQGILELVGLAGKAAMPVATYSHGMRRRLVLDEPAEGLDPGGISELRGLIKALARGGKSILLSSHLLHEIQLTCDRVAILKEGQVIMEGRVESLISRAPSGRAELEKVFFDALGEVH